MSQRPRERRAGGRPTPGVVALALGVAATAVAVPPLVLSWSGRDDASGPAPAPSAPAPAAPMPAVVTTVTATPTGPGPVAPSASPPSSPTTSSVPSTTPGVAVTVDAADPANLLSGSQVVDCATCESGSRVRYLGLGQSLTVRVPGVAEAGPHTMTIVYTSDGTRRLQVTVAGAAPVSLSLTGTGWETPSRVSIPVDLPAGDTEIVFGGPDPAPDIDRIVLE